MFIQTVPVEFVFIIGNYVSLINLFFIWYSFYSMIYFLLLFYLFNDIELLFIYSILWYLFYDIWLLMFYVFLVISCLSFSSLKTLVVFPLPFIVFPLTHYFAHSCLFYNYFLHYVFCLFLRTQFIFNFYFI